MIDYKTDRKVRRLSLRLLKKHPDWSNKRAKEEAIRTLVERGDINVEEG